MVKRPTGSGGELSSPNCGASAGVKARHPSLFFQMSTSSTPTTTEQPRNPLHGKTLQLIVEELQTYYGWAELAEQIPIRCFTLDPSVNSSLKFLRKTPWAREKVESLYLFMLRDIRRSGAIKSP